MPSVKISQLPAAATLAGDELLPAVQSGDTVAATVNDIRAGLAATDLSNVSNIDFAAKADAAGISGGGGTGGVDVGDATPQPLGVASSGTAASASREDHVHVLPSASDVGAAAVVHAHAIADTSGLQGALDGKLSQGKHTIWMPASAMTARTTGGAATGSFESATNKLTYGVLDFDAATVEYANFAVAMPKSWDRGTVSFQPLWTAASGTGGVAFSLAAVAIGDDDALDAAPGTAITVTDTLITANDLHVTGESAAVTISGTPAQGDMVVFQLARQVANASDTLAVDARLIGLRLFVTLTAGNDA